jgi:hypothetical protein
LKMAEIDNEEQPLSLLPAGRRLNHPLFRLENHALD